MLKRFPNSCAAEIAMPIEEIQSLQKRLTLIQSNTALCFDVSSSLMGFAFTGGGLTMDELVEVLKTTNAILFVNSAALIAIYFTLLFRDFGGKK